MTGPGPILACRPVELDPTDEVDRTTAKATFVYDGSVEDTCSVCERKVWVGPRQQVARALGAIVKCFRCALDDLPTTPMINLGNPQPNPKRRA